MDTITKKWCVRYVSSNGTLFLSCEFVGSVEDCVRWVEPKLHGSYAILPYDVE